jgi:hypothetical protein
VNCKSYFSRDFYQVLVVGYIKMIPSLVPKCNNEFQLDSKLLERDFF